MVVLLENEENTMITCWFYFCSRKGTGAVHVSPHSIPAWPHPEVTLISSWTLFPGPSCSCSEASLQFLFFIFKLAPLPFAAGMQLRRGQEQSWCDQSFHNWSFPALVYNPKMTTVWGTVTFRRPEDWCEAPTEGFFRLNNLYILQVLMPLSPFSPSKCSLWL